MIFAFVMWAIACPMGYVIGDVYCEKYGLDDSVIPFVAALFTPVAAIMAMQLISHVKLEESREENDG